MSWFGPWPAIALIGHAGGARLAPTSLPMKDARIVFRPKGRFHAELKARVDAYFQQTGLARDGGRAIVVKSAILLGTLALAWSLFLAAGGAWWATLGFGVIAGLAMGGLGMAVQHDGGHGAFSSRGRWNRVSAGVLDLMGASSYVWRVKHGHLHHTYPNIEGADDDIELAPLARLAPGQARFAHHRVQHLYMWLLYAFVGLKWYFIDDFLQLARGRVGKHPLPAPRGRDAWLFWGGKVVYGAWAIAIPIAVTGWISGLGFLLASQLTMGVLISVVFQLAHCVEEAEFVDPARMEGDTIELDFAMHQLATTVDFAREQSWITWYVGGLNFQAVHHLFPRVSHVHYPALSHIVARTCAEFGVRYRVSAGLWASVGSHYRWLRRMGREEPQPVAISAPALAAPLPRTA
jgi:linoleoyl-CoA desaturase